MVSAIIVAGGSGQRLAGPVPKQFLRLGRYPVLEHTLRTFATCREIGEIILVLPRDYVDSWHKRIFPNPFFKKVAAIVAGGSHRPGSVQNGLWALSAACRLVVIQDAVRPFATHRMIKECISAARRCGAAAVGLPAQDTVKRIKGRRILGTLDRRELLQVQTPQAFRRRLITRLYASGRDLGTDECYAAEKAGHRVAWVAGDVTNFKITTPRDLELARLWVRNFRP